LTVLHTPHLVRPAASTAELAIPAHPLDLHE
jgi:hypothetical protein